MGMLEIMKIPWLCVILAHQIEVNQQFLKKLKLDGGALIIHAASIQGTSTNQGKKIEITLGMAESNAAKKCNIFFNSHANSSFSKEEVDLWLLKRKFACVVLVPEQHKPSRCQSDT